MALNSGDKLGPYEVVAPLGAGGMGEVYKARDTRLERSVAVKVLPDHLAQREDARARFEREPRAPLTKSKKATEVAPNINSEIWLLR